MKIEATGEREDNMLHHHINCNLLFEDGIKANLVASRKKNMDNTRIMKICSNEETLELDLLNKIQKRIKKNNTEILECDKNSNPLKEELMDFYTSITQGTKPIVGVQEACASVNVAIQIDEIINNNIISQNV